MVGEHDDPMEHYDPIVQMQLAEFQRHILGATNSDMVIIITEKDGVSQCAVGSNDMTENEGKATTSALISQVAAAMIQDGTAGRMELLVKDKKTGDIYPAMGHNMKALVVKV